MNYYHQLIVVVTGLILSSCSQGLSHSQVYTDQEMRGMAANIDKQLIVDCVPPPKVRSRGGSVYLKKSNPLRTSVLSCRNRGGEFTVNADRQTRLEIWQAKANAGDVEAQTYVGEIYEKGLGTDPDYAFAAVWYKKAAEQGSKRAQNNLGFLYEKGLGVTKDHQQALKWYQKAAGINQAPVIKLSSSDIKELAQLRKEIGLKASEAEELHLQLELVQAQIQSAKLQTTQVETAQARVLRPTQNNNQALLAENRIESQRLQVQNEQYTGRLALLNNKIQILEIELKSANQNQEKQAELILKINHKTQETEQLEVSLNESKRLLLHSQNAITTIDKIHNTQNKQQTEQIAALNRIITQLKSQLTNTNKTLEIDKKIFSQQFWKGVNFGNYYALIIGNNQYNNLSKLRTPINDAQRLDKILRQKYSFKTKLLLNATRTDMLDALGDYRETLSPEDSLLIFYAGHGTLTEARGYWQGVNSTDNRISDWISNVDITDQLEQMSAKHILVVVDSCYSGAISRGSIEDLNPQMNETDKLSWIKQKLSLISRIAITSGGLYPVPDGAGKHSVFAHAFISHLENNKSVLGARSVFEVIEPRVISRAQNSDSGPEYARLIAAADENGEFYFKPVNISTNNSRYRYASLLWKTTY